MLRQEITFRPIEVAVALGVLLTDGTALGLMVAHAIVWLAQGVAGLWLVQSRDVTRRAVEGDGERARREAERARWIEHLAERPDEPRLDQDELTELAPEQVIEQVKASGLQGRGGAGFLTGL